MYDFLIVGGGLFGSVFAYEASKRGKKCLVIDKRAHIGGNCYTQKISENSQESADFLRDFSKSQNHTVRVQHSQTHAKNAKNSQTIATNIPINVHLYGAHIFRTSNAKIWDYIRQFADFNHFVNSPIANFNGEIYNLPFNMNTFSKLWGIKTPQEAAQIINSQRAAITDEPQNLEEKAISLVGTDIYEKLIKGYTQKQWGRECAELPASIIRRLPVRFTYDNNYFNDCFQGIPKGGYTQIFERLLAGCEVRLNTDFLAHRGEFTKIAKKIIYTGTIDGFFDYEFGELDYRSLRFTHEILPCENYQGVAVMNFTDALSPYTRIIEHKHFEFGTQDFTVISREFPQDFSAKDGEKEPYYPINDAKNTALYERYCQRARSNSNLCFAGRLGSYKYTDMQDTIIAALDLAQRELGRD